MQHRDSKERSFSRLDNCTRDIAQDDEEIINFCTRTENIDDKECKPFHKYESHLRPVRIVLLERRVIPLPGTPFHADSNELLFVSVALTLTEILVDCDRTLSSTKVDRSVSSSTFRTTKNEKGILFRENFKYTRIFFRIYRFPPPIFEIADLPFLYGEIGHIGPIRRLTPNPLAFFQHA